MSSSAHQTRSQTRASNISSAPSKREGSHTSQPIISMQHHLPSAGRASADTLTTNIHLGSVSPKRFTRLATLTHRTHQRQEQEEQVPRLAQAEEQMGISNEDDLQRDMKMRMQPIIQDYLNRTKRPLPIDLSLDMSAILQCPKH